MHMIDVFDQRKRKQIFHVNMPSNWHAPAGNLTGGRCYKELDDEILTNRNLYWYLAPRRVDPIPSVTVCPYGTGHKLPMEI